LDYKQLRYDIEQKTLSKYACFSKNTLGRKQKIDDCPIRTDFQRDRDRIIHSKAFRRLKHKTQVFLSPEGDHFRTRLTHTLEVSQIARTIARGLRLNEDLVEAISLGHDLGHTPFGHAGEDALTQSIKLYIDKELPTSQELQLKTIDSDEKRLELYRLDLNKQSSNILTARFEHNRQSLRIVDYLSYDGKGMNLTQEVRDGILHHCSKGRPSTLEGSIVHWSDKIAYINHDIDDAIRAGVLEQQRIPKEFDQLFGTTTGERINSMVIDFVESSRDCDCARPSKKFESAIARLRQFLFDNVYNNKPEEEKAKYIVQFLFNYFWKNTDYISKDIWQQDSPKLTKVCDFIGSMTDRYAIAIFEELTIPKSKTNFDFFKIK